MSATVLQPPPAPVRDHAGTGWRGRVARAVIGTLARALFRINVSGLEHLPAAGPYFVVAMHRSWLDPFLLETVLPLEPRPFIMGAKDAMENRWWKRALLRIFGGTVAIERGRRNGDGSALKAAQHVVAGGGVLVIFPEGTVAAQEGELLPVQRGIGHLVLQVPAPVVPVALSGTKDLYLRKPVTVTIGPVLVCEPGQGSIRERTDAIVRQVEQALRALLTPYVEPPARVRLFHYRLTHLFG